MTSTIIIHEEQFVHYIVQIMANMINYLNVSLYESQFVYVHEQARAKLNQIYDHVSITPSKTPSFEDINDFYNNVKYLINVTDTDDPDYYKYMFELKKYIIFSNKDNKHVII
jgi:hypothetical protein